MSNNSHYQDDDQDDDQADTAPAVTYVEPDPAKAYTYEQIKTAVNRAANDIETVAELPENGVVDALNLLVSAALRYLTDPAATLDTVAAGYDDNTPLSEIIGWFA